MGEGRLCAVFFIHLPKIFLQISVRMLPLLLLTNFKHFCMVHNPRHCRCLFLFWSTVPVIKSLIAKISALSPLFPYFLLEVLIDRKSFQLFSTWRKEKWGTPWLIGLSVKKSPSLNCQRKPVANETTCRLFMHPSSSCLCCYMELE